MSNIDKKSLREAAEKATGAHDRLSIIQPDDIFDISLAEGTQLDADITAMNVFNDVANPATVLALLDELEAAERRVAELEAREVTLPQVLDVHPLGPQSAKMFWAFRRDVVNECAERIRAAGIRINGED